MTRADRERRIGLAWAASSALGGALMVVPWKLANQIGDPANSVLLLLLTAAIANTLLGLAQRAAGTARRETARTTAVGVAALLAVFTLLGNHASAIAIQDLSPALLNVLLRADVLFVAVFGWLLLGERPDGRFWLGAAIAVTGLIVIQGSFDATGGGAWLQSGVGLAIAAAACFSGLAVTTRYFIRQIDPTSVNSIRLWIAVALWILFNPWPRFADIPTEQILYSTLAAITGPFLGRLALMNAARHLEARTTTLVTLATPVLTLGIAFLILSDWPENHELLGGAIMIAGISIPLLRIGQTSRQN